MPKVVSDKIEQKPSTSSSRPCTHRRHASMCHPSLEEEFSPSLKVFGLASSAPVPVAAQGIGSPIRGVNNDTWVDGLFPQLPPEPAALKRRQTRSFLATPAWFHNTALPQTTDLDWTIKRNDSKSFSCKFCEDVHPKQSAAVRCVGRHLDYHPPRQR